MTVDTRSGLWRVDTENSTYYINFDTKRVYRETEAYALENDKEWVEFSFMSDLKVGERIDYMWQRDSERVVRRVTSLVTKVTAPSV